MTTYGRNASRRNPSTMPGRNPFASSTTGPPLTGLVLWLRADAGITLSGSNVSHWADQSGNSNDYVQATSGKQPTVTASAINGLPAITFDGASQFLTSAFQIGGAKTVVLVRKLVSVPGSAVFFEAYTLKSASSLLAEGAYCGTGTGYQPYSLLHDIGAGTSVGDATALDTAWHVAEDTYNGGTNTAPASYTLALDAASQTVVASGQFNRTSTDLASLGARCNNGLVGSLFAPIQVAEMLVYDHVLSAPEETTARTYVEARYAIALGAP